MSDERPPQGSGGRRRAPRNARGRRGPTSRRILVPVVGALAAIAVLLILLTNCQGGFDAATTTTTPTTSAPTVTQPVIVPTPTPTPTLTHSPSPHATPTPTKTTPKATTSSTPSASATSTATQLTTVSIFNGTKKVGLAASYGKKLKAKGWSILTVANWASQTIKTTTIYYPPGQQAAAEKLAKDVGKAVIKPATSSAESSKALTLVLGTDAT